MNGIYENHDLFNRERIDINFIEHIVSNLTILGRLNYSKAHLPLGIHTHKNTLEIIYIARGRQTYNVGNTAYTLSGGDVYLTFPDEPHSSGESPEEKSVVYWVLIDFTDTRNFLNMEPEEGRHFLSLLNSLKTRKFKGLPVLKTLLDKMIHTYYSGSNFKKLLIQSYITEFLIHIIELEKKSESNISDTMQQVLTHIAGRIIEDISLDDLAGLSGLSLSRFKQNFKREVGIPPAEFILREKVALAGKLLKNSNKSVTDIAFELGFSSSHYFATVFKRLTGKTPTEYMRS